MSAGWVVSNKENWAGITLLEYRSNFLGAWTPMPPNTNGNSTLVINTTTFTNGPFVLEFRVSNEVGLTNYAYISNNVDQGAVVIVVTNPQADIWLTNTDVSFAGTNNADISAISALWWKTNDGVFYLFADTEYTNWSTNVVFADNETNYFYVVA